MTSALCDLSTCSLNSDKLTASCGCLAMPADTGNPAALQLGWTSAILAGNPLYRTAVDSCHKVHNTYLYYIYIYIYTYIYIYIHIYNIYIM